MTQVLQIPTPFADLHELTDNFAQRVDEERLMLPHVEPLPEGEWVQFSVLLGDGNVAIAGVGRVQGSFDNGEEHPPEYRFDVVLDSLQFEGMHEVMFERLLMARASAAGGEPVTGEVSVEELEQQAAAQAEPSPVLDDAGVDEVVAGDAAWGEEPAAAEAAWGEPAPAQDDWQAGVAAEAAMDAEVDAATAALDEAIPSHDVGTGEVDVGELAELASYGDAAATPAPVRESVPPARSQRPPPKRPPAAPYPTRPREPGKLPSPHAFDTRALTRASLEPAWTPAPAERPLAAESSGYFDYEGGVPRPAHPPRPEIDASLRVMAAPRPGAPWPRAQAAMAAAAAAVAMTASEPAAAIDESFEEDLGVESAQVDPADVDAADVDAADVDAADVDAAEGEREEW